MTDSYRKYITSPKGRYATHKSNAKTRGIEWKLTFEEWMEIWENSGKYEERGRTRGSYVMARILDMGPYEKGNVKIILTEKNSSEAHQHGLKFYTNKYKQKLDERLRARKPQPEVINIWPLNWATEEAKKNNPFLTGEPYVAKTPLFA